MIWRKRADDGLQNPAKKRPIKVVHPAKKEISSISFKSSLRCESKDADVGREGPGGTVRKCMLVNGMNEERKSGNSWTNNQKQKHFEIRRRIANDDLFSMSRIRVIRLGAIEERRAKK